MMNTCRVVSITTANYTYYVDLEKITYITYNESNKTYYVYLIDDESYFPLDINTGEKLIRVWMKYMNREISNA